MANFSKKDEGKWFYFDASDESVGGVKLRLLPPNEEDRIQKLTVTTKQKPIRGIMVETKTTDEKMKNRLTYDGWIVDWKDVELDGKIMSCTEDNKVTMMEVTDFARFVLESIISLGESNATIEEAKLKNLRNTSNGKKQNPIANDVQKLTKE